MLPEFVEWRRLGFRVPARESGGLAALEMKLSEEKWRGDSLLYRDGSRASNRGLNGANSPGEIHGFNWGRTG